MTDITSETPASAQRSPSPECVLSSQCYTRYRQPNSFIMCRKVDCDSCTKPTWKGCGMHIDRWDTHESIPVGPLQAHQSVFRVRACSVSRLLFSKSRFGGFVSPDLKSQCARLILSMILISQASTPSPLAYFRPPFAAPYSKQYHTISTEISLTGPLPIEAPVPASVFPSFPSHEPVLHVSLLSCPPLFRS